MSWLEQLIAQHATSQRVAALDVKGAVTGRMLMAKAAAAADYLSESVDREDAPLPALLSTNADALALILGGAAARRPLAPLGPQLAVPELAAMVSACRSDVLIAERRFAHVAHAVAQAADCRVLLVPELETAAAPLSSTGGPIAFYLHTAGTTGAPKRVRFTQSVLSARALLLAELFGFSPDSRYATGSPLHHVGGLGNTLAALSAGAAIMPTVRFTVDWWQGMARNGITHCLLVPAMIEMLLSNGVLGCSGLETLIYGGAPMAPKTLGRVLTDLPRTRLFNLYGQTEGSPIAVLDDDDHRRAAAGNVGLLSSSGRIAKGTRARIAQPDSHGVGELCVTGDHLAHPGPDGWLHTGDLGKFDADGYLFLSGRRHDMIVRGGENIYPVEVEHVLRRHPAVRDVGVVGVPDARLGETVAAFVVPVDDADPPTTDELAAAVRLSLAAFKVPTYWHMVTGLPYNAAGKLLRSSLMEATESSATGLTSRNG